MGQPVRLTPRQLAAQVRLLEAPGASTTAEAAHSKPTWRRVGKAEMLAEGAVLSVPLLPDDGASTDGPPAAGSSRRRPSSASAGDAGSSHASWLRALVLHKDEEVLVINKPAGLASQGGTKVARSLDSLMATALAYGSPEGGPRLVGHGAHHHLILVLTLSAIASLVHRLDKDTSGAMVLARTRRAAVALHAHVREKTALASLGAPVISQRPLLPALTCRVPATASRASISALTAQSTQFAKVEDADEDFQRKYWAVVAGRPARAAGLIDAPLLRVVLDDGGSDRIVVAHESLPGSRAALTRYAILATSPQGITLLELRPLTGRKHQLRVHCASALGMPIIGDRRYGWRPAEACSRTGHVGVLPPEPGLHLHCRQLMLPDLAQRFSAGRAASRTLRVTAPLPRHMAATWAALGWPPPDP
eukprot:SM000023S07647  [mRNA]  locus=s23:615338:617790:- [translate_table: standard]